MRPSDPRAVHRRALVSAQRLDAQPASNSTSAAEIASPAARTDCIAGPLPPRLLSEPLVEHGARKADVPSYSMAWQATSPHGLIDPACLDVEIPSGLLRAQESILGQYSRRVRC